jgi:hypothetical protein
MPESNFGLILPISRNMLFISYIHVLSAAFLMGLTAAAPIVPVNMLALRHGVIGGWSHTLACGIAHTLDKVVATDTSHTRPASRESRIEP